MKRLQVFLASAWLLALNLIACEPPQPRPSDETPPPAIDALREPVLQSLLEADEAWDRSTVAADSFASFFTDDALWLWVGGDRVSGIDEIRRVARGGWARPGFSLDWEPTSAGVNDTNDVGFTAGEWLSSYEGTDGVVNERTGSYMAIWTKGEDGEWKIEIEVEFPGQGIFRQSGTSSH
jgi:ketosteroid isomerase-like protein